MKKSIKIIILIVGVLALAAAVSFYPAMNLKTGRMEAIEKEHFVFYSEPDDRDAVDELNRVLETNRAEILEMLQFAMNDADDAKTRVYVYPNIEVLHTKKYGYLGRLFGPDWYIGDNRKDRVLIVSPNHPGPSHTRESVVGAVVHEYVHSIIDRINPKTVKWLDEGLAGYISGNTKPGDFMLNGMDIPSYRVIHTRNPITFGNKGLYPLSYTYIDFLQRQYGKETIARIVREPDYQKVFHKLEKDIYDEWVKDLNIRYGNVR